MRKIPGKVINPVRVEVPIACALPDALVSERRRPDSAGRARLLTWAKAMKLNLGLVQIDLSSFGAASATITPGPNTPAAVSQLVRYCSGKLDRLESEFPESDLVRFLYRHGT